jgi:hypothetical protein
MSSRKRRMTSAVCLVLAAALPMILGSVQSAAAASKDKAPPLVTKWRIGEIPEGTPGLEDLDEVMVRGRRVAIAIADLEDDYYKLYNKLNKDNSYDVHCYYLNTDPDNPGSALRSRVCMPEFVIDAMLDWNQGRCEVQDFTTLDLNKDHVLSESEVAGSKELLNQFWDMDTDHDGRITYLEFNARSSDYIPTACYTPPSPELVLMAGTDKWYKQMTKVTASDPRLQKMADNLGDLYGQLKVLQRQAGKLEGAAKAKKVKR